MSLFKKDESKSDVSKSRPVAMDSLVGHKLTLTGDVNFKGKLKVDGQIHGNVEGEHIILGESGHIHGNIDVETCTCQGKVTGNIRAKVLRITKASNIKGNVSATNLTVESGASLNGEVKVDEKDLRLVKNSSAIDADHMDEAQEN